MSKTWWQTLEARVDANCKPSQSAACHLGAFAASAGSSHSHQRFRVMRELVRPRPKDAARHDVTLSGGLASMGAAVPYAIAAKFAHPDAVIALVGDGAMQMNNMAELITVSSILGRWSNPKWICLRLQQRRSEPGHVGAARHGGRSQSKGDTAGYPDVPYHRFAELVGLREFIRRPGATGGRVDQALGGRTGPSSSR